ncbi:hypothetical protein GCM10008967_02730 [Bacillus carboniphilus]|uniref:Uncharacterized protein n=1 Tax=Bacillus carboniphilus TaxID=86663 RepID=A0ABN0VRN4_9BACI
MYRQLLLLPILALALLLLPSPDAQAATNEELVQKAKEYEGVRYSFGGNSPTSGFDCSGYLVYVMNQLGMTLPRTSADQYQLGTAVDKSNLQPGDFVFFKNTYKAGISHSGIYVGDNKFISATSSSGVAIVSLSNSYWSKHYAGAKRLSGITYDGFTDLSKEHKAYTAIMALHEDNIISGYNDNSFKPETPITRGQAAAILNRVLGLKATDLNPFTDVNPNTTFAHDIAAIKSLGIINGFPDGTFRPNEYLTRAQMAYIVDHAFIQDSNAASSAAIVYKDVGSEYWAYSSIVNLHGTDKISFFNGPNFRATDRASRADFSVAIYSSNY